MYINYLFSLLFLLTVSSIYGNDNGGALSGVVTDAISSQPLQGVSVSIPDLKIATLTDKEGRYNFNSVPNGTLTFLFSNVGFHWKAWIVTVRGVTRKDFSLHPSVVENDKVPVTGYPLP